MKINRELINFTAFMSGVVIVLWIAIKLFPPCKPPVKITFMAAITPGTKADSVLKQQIAKFNSSEKAKRDSIEANLKTFPYDQFYDSLIYSIDSLGKPPDIAVLPHNLIAKFEQEEKLSALNTLLEENKHKKFWDYLLRNLKGISNTSRLYGLPWQVSVHTPHPNYQVLYYRYVALFKASKCFAEAFELIDFLTDPLQQTENHKLLGIIPAIETPASDKLPSDDHAIHPSPDIIPPTMKLVEERAVKYDSTLQKLKLKLDPSQATVLVDENNKKKALDVFVAPVTKPFPGDAVTGKNFELDAISKDGVIVGCLFIEGKDSVQIELSDHNPIRVAPGDYLIKWQITQPPQTTDNREPVNVTLVPLKEDTQSIPLGSGFVTKLTDSDYVGTPPSAINEKNIEQPVILVQKRKICIYIDHRSGCMSF